MKRLIFVVILLTAAWGFTPLWVPLLAQRLVQPAKPAPSQIPENTIAKPSDLATAGQLGDMFGTINSLFSGFALIGVAYGLYLQIQHKRREKQPEVFARLASTEEERPIVLARNDSTPLGKVQFSMQVPVYIEAGIGAIAMNVAMESVYANASKRLTLPTPIFTGIKFKNVQILNLTIDATDLSPMIPNWREKEPYPLGQLALFLEFENQQKARWRVSAKYDVSVRSEEDAEALKTWINKAADSSIPTKEIELDAISVTWQTDEL